LQRLWWLVLSVITASAVTLAFASSAFAADPVIFAVGDIACAPGSAQTSTTCHERQTSDIVLAGAAAKALPLGDLQYDSASLSNLQNSYNNTWGRFKSITTPVIGNHEGSASGYWDYFYGSGVNSGPLGARGKGWYSYNVGAWHLIALNSNCDRVSCTAGSEQEQWLKADLAANPAACTLAYWHHPRWSSGHDGDGTFMQPMWQDLYNADADVALVGHSHDYERYAPQNASGQLDNARGIREFVVGTGGAFFTGISSARPNSQVRQNNTYGVLKLTLHPTSYDWQFVPEPGKTFTDSGTDSCHGPGGPAPPPTDTQAPTAPTNLAASSPNSTRVDLTWNASSDNIAVTGYEIFRNGTLITTTSGTTFADTPVTAGTSYTYQVRAIDAAGNRSAFSNSVPITTAAAGNVIEVAPEADAHVRQASPTSNYGTVDLRADGGTDPAVDSYLKFTLNGVGPVQNAKLRLYAFTSTVDGPAVYSTDTAWSETGLNWNTRPATTSPATDDKTSIASNSWVEYNVSSFVTGNGTYSFRLAQTSTDGVDFYSREFSNAALRPRLVVTTIPGGDGQSPTPPSGLSASAPTPNRIDLAWNGSTDNVGVTGYEVFRGGSLLATVTGTTFSDTAVSPGTSYSYQVRALDAATNRSGFSNTATATVPNPPDNEAPTTPGNLTATASSATQVDLSWNAAGDNVGVSGYEIFRNGALLTTKNATSHADTTVSMATAYSYQVRALDAAGNRSPFGSTVTVTTPAQTTFRIAPEADARVTESSPATNYATSYLRADGAADPDVDSYLRFPVTGVAGTIQSAKLRVYAYSGTVDGPTVYATATNWSETAINWNTRPPMTSGPVADTANVATNSWAEYNVTPIVTGNGTYSFRLASASTDGIDIRSREHTDATVRPELVLTVTPPDTQPPSVPANLTGSAVAPTQVKLSWNASTDNIAVTGYEVFRDGTQIGTVAGTTFDDAGATPETAHSYRVRALDAASNRSALGDPTIVVTPAPPDTQPPTAPANLIPIAAGPNRVDLTWDASTDNRGVVAYEIYRDNTLIATATGPSWSDTSAAASTTYSYKVRALDAAGNASGFSNTATATTPAPPDTQAPTDPANLIPVAAAHDRVDLTWDASNDNVGVAAYEIYRDDTLIGTATAPTYSDTTPVGSTTYSYKVRALDAAGNASGFSNAVSVTTPAPPDVEPPTDPANLVAAAIGPGQVDLSWDASSDNVAVSGYEVYRDGSSIGTAGGTTYSDTTVWPFTTYAYQVRALDAAGNHSALSNEATATTPLL
jgi:chitodextrinase